MENTNPQAPVVNPQNIMKPIVKAAGSKSMAMLIAIGVVVAALGAGGGFLISKGGVMGLSTKEPTVPGSID